MSSIAQCPGAVHLLIFFSSVLVCEGGFVDFGKFKHEGDGEYKGGALLQKAQAMIEFPELNEMNSAERAANRQRARKVATIIEKSTHMMVNDILQMWAIARTDKDDGEDTDVETEGEGDAEGRGGESSEEGAETIEGSGVNSSSAAVPQQTSEGLGANKIEGKDAKTTNGVGAESTKGDGDETTKGVGVKLTKVVEGKSNIGEEARRTEGVEAMSTKGAQSKTTKVPRNNNPEGKEGSSVTHEGVRKSEALQNTNDLKKPQIMRSKETQHGKYIISDGKSGRTLLQLGEMLVK